MSDFDPNTSSAPSPDSSKRRRRFVPLAIVGGLVAALLAVPVAMAGARAGASFGHCSRGDGATLTEEGVRERMAWGAQRVLGHVDATDEQRAAVDAILDEVAPAVVEHRAASAELKAQLHTAVQGETIDVDALEAVRGEFLAHVDAGTAEALDVAVELAEILTPEQRAELLDRWNKMGFGPGAR